jgi:hypothetical protein
MFDPTAKTPCTAVVEAVEQACGTPQDKQPVLAESIDPDTLTQLYREETSGSWMLCFDHAGIEITIWGTGRIHVDTATGQDSSVLGGETSNETHC